MFIKYRLSNECENICNIFSHTIDTYLAIDLLDFYAIVVHYISTKWIGKYIYALGRKENTVKTLATEYRPQRTLLT